MKCRSLGVLWVIKLRTCRILMRNSWNRGTCWWSWEGSVKTDLLWGWEFDETVSWSCSV